MDSGRPKVVDATFRAVGLDAARQAASVSGSFGKIVLSRDSSAKLAIPHGADLVIGRQLSRGGHPTNTRYASRSRSVERPTVSRQAYLDFGKKPRVRDVQDKQMRSRRKRLNVSTDTATLASKALKKDNRETVAGSSGIPRKGLTSRNISTYQFKSPAYELANGPASNNSQKSWIACLRSPPRVKGRGKRQAMKNHRISFAPMETADLTSGVVSSLDETEQQQQQADIRVEEEEGKETQKQDGAHQEKREEEFDSEKLPAAEPESALRKKKGAVGQEMEENDGKVATEVTGGRRRRRNSLLHQLTESAAMRRGVKIEEHKDPPATPAPVLPPATAQKGELKADTPVKVTATSEEKVEKIHAKEKQMSEQKEQKTAEAKGGVAITDKPEVVEATDTTDGDMRSARDESSMIAAGVNQSRLADLCDEDKQKVAHLVQQLVRVGKELEEKSRDWQKSQETYERRCEIMQEEKERAFREAASVRERYNQNLIMVKQYQDKLIELSWGGVRKAETAEGAEGENGNAKTDDEGIKKDAAHALEPRISTVKDKLGSLIQSLEQEQFSMIESATAYANMIGQGKGDGKAGSDRSGQSQYAAEMLEKYILMANSALLKMKTIAGGDRGDDNGSISRSTVLAVSPPASHAASAQQGPIGANGHVISTDLPTGVAEGTPAMSKSSARTPRSHLLRLIKIQEDAWSPSSKVSRVEKDAAIMSMSMNQSKNKIDTAAQSDAIDLLDGSAEEKGGDVLTSLEDRRKVASLLETIGEDGVLRCILENRKGRSGRSQNAHDFRMDHMFEEPPRLPATHYAHNKVDRGISQRRRRRRRGPRGVDDGASIGNEDDDFGEATFKPRLNSERSIQGIYRSTLKKSPRRRHGRFHGLREDDSIVKHVDFDSSLLGLVDDIENMQDDGNSVKITHTNVAPAVTPFLQKSPSPERKAYRRERWRERSRKPAVDRMSHESIQSTATSLTEEDAQQIFSLMDSISSIEDQDLDRKSVSFQLSGKPEGRRRRKRSRRFRRGKRY